MSEKTPLKLSGNLVTLDINRETGTVDDPKIETINDWEPEVRDLLEALVSAGCELVSGDNGEDRFKFRGDLAKFIEELIACDEAHVYLKTPSGKVRWLYLVLGNSPGELASEGKKVIPARHNFPAIQPGETEIKI
jgi:hypothetical protein